MHRLTGGIGFGALQLLADPSFGLEVDSSLRLGEKIARATEQKCYCQKKDCSISHTLSTRDSDMPTYSTMKP
jgi:hypothetical protein